jgi:hypothetical protein
MLSQKLHQCDDPDSKSHRSVGLVACDEGAYFVQADEGTPWTRQSLTARHFIAVLCAAGAFWQRQFTISAPGKQPRLHVFVLNVVPCCHFAIRLAKLRQHSFLVRHAGFDRVRNEKIGTPPRSLRELSQPLLYLWSLAGCSVSHYLCSA